MQHEEQRESFSVRELMKSNYGNIDTDFSMKFRKIIIVKSKTMHLTHREKTISHILPSPALNHTFPFKDAHEQNLSRISP
jgi:hypothetical protein